MKILFTADIHYKLGQKNVPIEWAKRRYTMLQESLLNAQKDADMFIIGGDIFDKLPNMEELEIYYDLVAACSIPTIIYPGNHESVKKDTTFFTHLKSVTNRLNSKVEVIDSYLTCADFDIIPYNKLKEFEKDQSLFPIPKKLLFTHVRGAIEPHVKPEVDLSIFDRWQTVLAGDLHSYDNCQRNILYPGSPVTTSFHRNTVDTGVIIFDTDTHTHEWRRLEVPQLLRKTIQAGEPMPATPYHHTIYEIEGDMSELGEVADNELISKKIIKRDNDTKLILDPKASLQEELKEYLLYILNLPEAKADELVNVLNNNMNKITE